MKNLLALLLLLFAKGSLFAANTLNPNEKRYAPAVLKEVLPSPWKICPGIEDRTYWDQCKKRFPDATASVIAKADNLLKQGPLPAPSDEEFLLFFSPSGDRTKFQKTYFTLQSALRDSTLAACFTGDSKYVDYVEQLLHTYCGMRTWVLSAHDRQKTNFNGTFVTMDLGSTLTARDIAAARQLLATRLKPETKQAVDAAIRKFILVPLAETVSGKRKPQWQFTKTTNNWNAVCLSGIVGVLLMTDMDADVRAEQLSWCLENSTYYLNSGSFAKDGYCTEGVGYWMYGYGYYLDLALEILQATEGKLNIALRTKAKLPGKYIDSIPITPECYPNFADCASSKKDLKSYQVIIGLRDILWDVPDSPYRARFNSAPRGELTRQLLCFQLPPQPVISGKPVLAEYSEFPSGGIFLCRPGKKGGVLSAAFKGGSNHEQHNHNDVGTYILVVDNTPVVDEVGAVVYTRQTFGPERYQSNAINSYGHSVPLIGGKLQITGAKTDAKVLSKLVSPNQTSVKLDIRKAYPADLKIKTLTREFRYARGTKEFFSVEDQGRFAAPQTFETAIMTFGSCEKQGDRLLITYKKKQLAVKIETFGAAFTVSEEPLVAKIRRKEKATRICIRLTEPTATPRVRLTFQPVK